MHHKLQSSSSKNDGKNSVVRKQQAKTNRQKSRDLKAEARSGRNEADIRSTRPVSRRAMLYVANKTFSQASPPLLAASKLGAANSRMP